MCGSDVAESAGCRGAVPRQTLDIEAAEKAASEFLAALGIAVDGDVLRDTPRRMALAYAEFLSPQEFTPTVFEPVAGYERMIIMRNIAFISLCEHHALPFEGTADVAYLPRGRIVGLSKLARIVDLVARQPQMQERMTAQVADMLEDILDPNGVGVRLQARHMCVSIRGARAAKAVTTTSVLRGEMLRNPAFRLEWLIQTSQGRPSYEYTSVLAAHDGMMPDELQHRCAAPVRECTPATAPGRGVRKRARSLMASSGNGHRLRA